MYVCTCVCVFIPNVDDAPLFCFKSVLPRSPSQGSGNSKTKQKRRKAMPSLFPPFLLLLLHCVSSELQATTLSCKTKNGTSACFQVVVSFCCVFFNEPRLRSLRPESLTTDRNRSQTLSPRRMTCTASPFIHFGLMFCELSPRSSLLLPFYLFIFRRQSILHSFFYRDFFFCLCSFLWLLFL